MPPQRCYVKLFPSSSHLAAPRAGWRAVGAADPPPLVPGSKGPPEPPSPANKDDPLLRTDVFT